MGGWKFASDSQDKTQLNKQGTCVIFLKNNYERLLNYYKNRITPPLAPETALLLAGCCQKC